MRPKTSSAVASGGEAASETEVIPPTPPRQAGEDKVQPSTSPQSDIEANPGTSASQSSQPPSSSLQQLIDRQKEAVREVFKNDIEAGLKLQLKHVRNKMCTKVILRSLIINKAKVKQVLNLVNYLIEKRPCVKPEDLLVVEDWEVEDDESLKSGPRQFWDDEDIQAIHRHFMKFDSCPSKDVIRDMFQTDEELFTIQEK